MTRSSRDTNFDIVDDAQGDIGGGFGTDPSDQSHTPGASHVATSRTSHGEQDAESVDVSLVDDSTIVPQHRQSRYENLASIDWLQEYSRERRRVRSLKAGDDGLLASATELLDGSHSWIVLVSSGLLIGVVAAAINIASDWLGDIKTGYCKDNGKGMQFYLSKQFCCWGHDDLSKCDDWTPWRRALHIENLGGAYLVEYIFYVIYATLFASVAAILVQRYSPYARQSGIPEIKAMLGGVVLKDFLGTWTLATKAIGICLSVASGLWLGKEGPLVHLACCCADLAMKPFAEIRQNEARKREIISAAAASGISVAFGAPVGGVLFSLEQLSYYFPDRIMWSSFVCAMVAAVTLQALNPFHTGKIVLYQVQYTTGWHGFEFIPFVMLGLFGGIFGGVFINLNKLITALRQSKTYPLADRPVTEVGIVAFMIALINFPNLFMRAQLSELVYYLFAECDTIGDNDIFGLCKVTTAGTISMIFLLLAAALLGAVLTALTFGLAIPAGVILPSLAVGALYGRATGMIMEILHKHFAQSVIFSTCEPDIPCITPGTYAIVGAASALAGTTRMTVSIVVIMFELTGALAYVLPIMVAVLLAKWIGDTLTSKGIYESWIAIQGYLFISSQEDIIVPACSVERVMTRLNGMVVIDADRLHSAKDLQQILAKHNFRGFPVITNPKSGQAGMLYGYIARDDLANPTEPITTKTSQLFSFQPSMNAGVSSIVNLHTRIDKTPLTLNLNAGLPQAVSMFQQLGLRYLLIVDRGILKGMLTRKDVWQILSTSIDRTYDGSHIKHGLRQYDHTDSYDEAEGLLDEHG